MTKSHKYFLYISASIFVLLAFLWYNHSITNGEPPLLKADHSPKRIKPDNTDKNIVSDNIYDTIKNQSESTKTVNLLPEPEIPININDLQKTVPQEDAIDSIIAGIVDREEKQHEAEEVGENKALNIVTIADDKSGKTNLEPSRKKEYYIQIASTRGKDQANKEWIRVSKAQSKLLSGLGHKIVKYELGSSGIFYQLLVGPLSNSSHTKLICKKLVNAKMNCVIKRI
jgi:hypothetical protein